jgi:hypothetical protein
MRATEEDMARGFEKPDTDYDNAKGFFQKVRIVYKSACGGAALGASVPGVYAYGAAKYVQKRANGADHTDAFESAKESAEEAADNIFGWGYDHSGTVTAAGKAILGHLHPSD